MGGVGLWELHGATQGGSFLFSFQLFLCLEQEVHVTHRFSLHLSFFPFPPTIIKQRHVLEMLGILPEVCTRAKKHQPLWWSTRACLLNSSRWTHDTQVNFLQVPRVLVSSGELLDKIKKKKSKRPVFSPQVLQILIEQKWPPGDFFYNLDTNFRVWRPKKMSMFTAKPIFVCACCFLQVSWAVIIKLAI